MPRTRLSLALGFAVALACTAVGAQDHGHIDKVHGSITAQSGQSYGNLETVNGSIRIESSAQVGDAETVNGSITASDNISAHSLSTVNGSIRIGSQARIDGSIETVNGSVFVDRGGEVRRDIETVNGAIGLVDTDLAGGIETVNGDVTVGAGSHVHGGIRIDKPDGWGGFQMGQRNPPKIIIGPNAQVDGPMSFERPVLLYVHSTAKVGRITGATPVRYSTDRAPIAD